MHGSGSDRSSSRASGTDSMPQGKYASPPTTDVE